MADMCNDNRFVLIEKYKQKLIEATNISDRQEEMAVIDSILFRFWQMGWLDKLEQQELILEKAKEEIYELKKLYIEDLEEFADLVAFGMETVLKTLEKGENE